MTAVQTAPVEASSSASNSEFRTVLINGKGGREQLELHHAPKRPVKAGEIALRVRYAGVCFADIMAREGMYPSIPPYPYVPGYECSGVVDEVGDSVEGYAPGDRVVAYLPTFGCYTQRLVTTSDCLAPIPDNVTFRQAACVPVNYMTAHVLLHRIAQAQRGERVVVTSGAGGVGTAVLDLGRIAGLEMYGVSSASKLGVVSDRGATAIDRSKNLAKELRGHAPQGVDVFIDNVAGETFKAGYRLLRKGGRLICNGTLSLRGNSKNDFLWVLFGIFARRLLPDSKHTAFNWGLPPIVAKDSAWFSVRMKELLGAVADEHFDPLVGDVLPLAEATKAHKILEEGRTRGKILLDCEAS